MLAGAVIAAGCSGGGSPTPSTSTTTTTSAPSRFARGEPDGVLTIGVLLPRTGSGESLGKPLVDVITAAVAAVNAAGGVHGHDVRLRTVDEADSSAADDLLDDPSIDAIIGPASSRVALSVLPTITAAGVAACSPTATSIALTGMPDGGLFMRTVPSDALQAKAMARLINQTGLGEAAILFTDDVYGRPFASAIHRELIGYGVTVTGELPYDPNDDDLSDEAAAVVAAGPPVVAVVGDTASGGRMVSALLATGPSAPQIVVNDAVRDADFTRTDLTVLTERVTGVSVSAYEGSALLEQLFGSSQLSSAAFASSAVDCVNLLALGAVESSPDDPAAIVASAISLSVGGVPCTFFADCIAAMTDGRKVDYNGPSGFVALDSNGDLTRANFEVYGFTDTGAVEKKKDPMLVSFS